MSSTKTEANLIDQKLFEIETIPDSVVWNHSAVLTSLNLSHNFIETIPDQLGLLWNLQRLNLFDNKLKTISDSISKLQKIDVDGLPTNFFTLKNLERLYLSDNRMECVVKEFSRLSGLRVLALRDNLLIRICEDIDKLDNLEELHLQGNRLRYLPPNLGNVSGLSKPNGCLKLDENPLIQPILDQKSIGTRHLLEYLTTTNYKFIYQRDMRKSRPEAARHAAFLPQ